jgi:hypothetical protein
VRNKLNLLDLNLFSEDSYARLFNLVFGYNLKNANEENQNAAGFDLIDSENKIIVQVSATNTKAKIESSLRSEILKDYSNYKFLFISIAKDASSLRTKNYNNPYNIRFNPQQDIYDVHEILRQIQHKGVDELKAIYQLLEKELGNIQQEKPKLDSNLTTIIKILAKEDLSNTSEQTNTQAFEIENKIDFNNLIKNKPIIKDYCVYNKKVDEKYSVFDANGANKSIFVLRNIRDKYLTLKGNGTADNIFSQIIENVKDEIVQSANFDRMTSDELDMCVHIIVVDAFFRCKIFEKPVN